jgi:Spy/CpxP family protein refolding chaperone
VKSRAIIAAVILSGLAISASAQRNDGPQAAQDSVQPGSGHTASPAVQLPSGAAQDTGTYPERLQEVVGAMSAELGEIGQAAREGRISRDQAEYLSLERYYVALTRFELLRSMYQGSEVSSPQQTYSQANIASQASGGAISTPPIACSPEIPNQLVDYLRLTPVEIQALQTQVTEECKQVQPLVERLDESRRKLLSMKVNGQAGEREVQAVAAEQSEIMKQLIVMNSQLETKLYSMLTTEQQRRIDALLRKTLDSGEALPVPQ